MREITSVSVACSDENRKVSAALNALWIAGNTAIEQKIAHQIFERLVGAANLASALWPDFYAGKGLTRLVYHPAAAPPADVAEIARRSGIELAPLDLPLELVREQCDVVLAESATGLLHGLPVVVIASQTDDAPAKAHNTLDELLPIAPGARTYTNAASATDIARAIFSPPRGFGEAKKLRDYQNENPRGSTSRFEYEVLLRLIGEKPVSGAPPDHSWEDTLAAAQKAGPSCAATVAKLHTEFECADIQALTYGQRWRSSLVSRSFMLLLATAMSGLVGTLFPRLIVVTVPIQVLATLWMFLDRRFAMRRRWREKWLEYRTLAERARIARFCILARAPLPDTSSTSWLDWRLRRIVHAAPPLGPLGEAAAADVLEHLRSVEIGGQIAYHHAAFRRFRRLDARLKRTAVVALFSTMTVGSAFAVLALAGARTWSIPLTSALSLCLSAAPSLYAALGGLRTQFDVARQAQRSGRIATGLRRLSGALAEAPASPALARAAALRAASIMSQDIESWERVMEIV